MTTAIDILRELQAAGYAFRLEGDRIKIRPLPPPATMEFLRQHKPALVALLKAEAARTFTRLELADAALGHLIPDEQAQRRIRALAESDAKHWRFLGADGYQHVLSNDIIDSVEQATKKLICFSVNPDNKFTGWYTKEIHHGK